MPGGISVAGPHAQTSAPMVLSSSTFERSTRLCSRSPTIATLRPGKRPLCSRMVNASSSACVGCSCMPSPALMIADRQMRASSSGAPDEAWRMHDHVWRHRFEVADRVDERLSLGHARRRGGDAQGVGAEALLGDLERRPRPRARLEEQVDDGAAAQRRHLLDRAAADLLHRLGGIEDQRDLVGVEAGDPEQVPASFSAGCRRRRRPDRFGARSALSDAIDDSRGHGSPSMTISSVPSISWRRTCTLCLSDVGRFLPT